MWSQTALGDKSQPAMFSHVIEARCSSWLSLSFPSCKLGMITLLAAEGCL